MPDCHKCPHNGKRSEACHECKGPADTDHKGRSHVSIDSLCADGRVEQTYGEVEASSCSLKWRDEKRRFPNVHHDAVKVAVAFLSLSEAEFTLVKVLTEGASMASVSRKTGLTRAAISAKVKRLVEKHPVFAFLRH